LARNIFVPARGQYDNIGDILLRRQLLDWVRASGPLHVYVGHSPAGYDEGLQLSGDDVVYRSFRTWYVAALKDALRRKASYVFKPGEIQLTVIGMKEHLSMLPVLALVRLTGGAVARVGTGSRNFAPLPRVLIWPSIALSSIILWRDAETAKYLGGGEVMPDLGFGEGDGGASNPAAVRDSLVVSMRSDRPYPSPAWIQSVKELAARHDLKVWTVTQVLRDNDKAAQLAKDLDGEALLWDGTAHHEQEERLRALYSRSAVAVSDRLHVLIGAVTEGALPAAMLVDESDKIKRHFDAAGIAGVTIHSRGVAADELGEKLEALLARGPEIMAQLALAKGELDRARTRVRRVLSGQASR
jgi:hypothetical protein